MIIAGMGLRKITMQEHNVGESERLSFHLVIQTKGAACDEPGSPYSHGGWGVRDCSVCVGSQAAHGGLSQKVTERKGHNLKKKIYKQKYIK